MENIKCGDYVLASKWHDGDGYDHWCVGFYQGKVRTLVPERHLVANENGETFRHNGFRRVEKITALEGNTILNEMADSHSVWTLLEEIRGESR